MYVISVHSLVLSTLNGSEEVFTVGKSRLHKACLVNVHPLVHLMLEMV